jgi:hypothetical protein
MYENFSNNCKNINFELSEKEKNSIREKLEIIIVEKAEITCRSIKFSVRIMIKLLNYMLEEKDKNSISKTELLLKLKLFLKITKLIIDNTCIAEEYSTQKQKDFFNM